MRRLPPGSLPGVWDDPWPGRRLTAVCLWLRLKVAALMPCSGSRARRRDRPGKVRRTEVPGRRVAKIAAAGARSSAHKTIVGRHSHERPPPLRPQAGARRRRTNLGPNRPRERCRMRAARKDRPPIATPLSPRGGGGPVTTGSASPSTTVPTESPPSRGNRDRDAMHTAIMRPRRPLPANEGATERPCL
jgi:hypothetical protein